MLRLTITTGSLLAGLVEARGLWRKLMLVVALGAIGWERTWQIQGCL